MSIWAKNPAAVAPVHLGLGAGDDLEPAVHFDEFLRRDAEFLGMRGRAS
jgi:hypothetical protein